MTICWFLPNRLPPPQHLFRMRSSLGSAGATLRSRSGFSKNCTGSRALLGGLAGGGGDGLGGNDQFVEPDTRSLVQAASTVCGHELRQGNYVVSVVVGIDDQVVDINPLLQLLPIRRYPGFHRGTSGA